MPSIAENAKRLVADIEGAADVDADTQEEALLTAAEPLVEEMAARAPRSAGPPTYDRHLSETMNTETVEKDEVRGVTVRVGPGPQGAHGIFTEIGTPFMSPDPWLRPSFDDLKGSMIDTIRNELGGGL